MPTPGQTNNETPHVEINHQPAKEPSIPVQSVKSGGANFYDNHIIRQMPLPSWDTKDYS